MTTTPTVDDDTRVVLDVDLDAEVPCTVTQHITCDRPARWRIYWHPLCCSHRPEPGLLCDRHREVLTTVPVLIICPRCCRPCAARPHIARVEAL